MRVYLAGPDVFLPQQLERASTLKGVCARNGLIGVSPLDDGALDPSLPPGMDEAVKIAMRNESHIRSCDALIANLTPFRGPSADVGTVFELGYMRALGRPVFGWSNDAALFLARARTFTGAVLGEDRCWRDAEGLLLEDFGLRDNLMIDGAIAMSGGSLIVRDVPAGRRWRDLDAFEDCVAAAARLLIGQRAQRTSMNS